jgi:cytochrome c peroxidase
VIERLRQVPEYEEGFKKAFGGEPTYGRILDALVAWMRTLRSQNAPLDRYLAGDDGAIGEGAKRGLSLFRGKARCVGCHDGPLLTDESFHDVGTASQRLFESDPLRQVALRFQHYARGVPEDLYRRADRDLGLYYVTKRDPDKGKFRTPPLRYLTYTAPYMHNGVLATLEDVVEFYDKGGGDDAHKSPLLAPLHLEVQEKADLVSFLESLSGSELRVLAPELPPYAAKED